MSWTNEVFKIRDNLYCIRDVHSVNKYLMIGSEKALLFDTGYGFVDFTPMIEKLTDRPVTVVNSHADPDHMLGNYLFREVYISRYDYKTLQISEQPAVKKQQLEYRQKKSEGRLQAEMESAEQWMSQSVYAPEYHLIDAGYLFDLGDLRLEVIAMPGHTSGSVVLLEKKNGWLFTGDSVMAYNVFYIPAGDPPRCPEPMRVYYDSLVKLYGRIEEISSVYPGHGDYGISPDIILETIHNLEEIYYEKGEFEEIVTYRGAKAIKHQYGKSLIYFDDEYAEGFRKSRI